MSAGAAAAKGNRVVEKVVHVKGNEGEIQQQLEEERTRVQEVSDEKCNGKFSFVMCQTLLHE